MANKLLRNPNSAFRSLDALSDQTTHKKLMGDEVLPQLAIDYSHMCTHKAHFFTPPVHRLDLKQKKSFSRRRKIFFLAWYAPPVVHNIPQDQAHASGYLHTAAANYHICTHARYVLPTLRRKEVAARPYRCKPTLLRIRWRGIHSYICISTIDSNARNESYLLRKMIRVRRSNSEDLLRHKGYMVIGSSTFISFKWAGSDYLGRWSCHIYWTRLYLLLDNMTSVLFVRGQVGHLVAACEAKSKRKEGEFDEKGDADIVPKKPNQVYIHPWINARSHQHFQLIWWMCYLSTIVCRSLLNHLGSGSQLMGRAAASPGGNGTPYFDNTIASPLPYANSPRSAANMMNTPSLQQQTNSTAIL
ncbi:mediator subunit 8 [Artemisia annua]|uniref:Mediator subunit 8 n=1 Tax=Artemisia annua TaxID=35608 RepID=A0A2U1MAV0_ARTAN|nr:mediator subunit 8 [Artemisia annua]